jgi:hypothetical protein
MDSVVVGAASDVVSEADRRFTPRRDRAGVAVFTPSVSSMCSMCPAWQLPNLDRRSGRLGYSRWMDRVAQLRDPIAQERERGSLG